MTRETPSENAESMDRRTFVERSAVASVGLGLGETATFSVGPGGDSSVETQEEPGVQYYNFVVPDRGIVESDYVNKFLFVTEFRRQLDENPFSGCFAEAEKQVEDQFRGGASVYDGVLIDATEAFQLFGGDDEAVERLRQLLGGEGIDLPKALDDNIGAIVGTRIFAPATAGRLPTDEGYRSAGGESCDGGYVRLYVHELPNEVTQ